MAMTKAEKAQMEALKKRLALTWPPEPPKPIDIKAALAASEKPWIRAWWVNEYKKRVGIGIIVDGMHDTDDYTDEQIKNRYKGPVSVSLRQTHGGPWYASKAEALAALQYTIASRCADELYVISKQIEQTLAEEVGE